MVLPKGYYYGLDCGTGKTKCAIDYSNGFFSKMVLIVCPNSVIPVWPEQFDIHSGREFECIYFEKKISIAQKAGIIKSEIERLQKAEQNIALILNYEAFWRPPIGPTVGKKSKILDKGLLMAYLWDLIIYDEAHRLQTPGSKQSWGAKHLRPKAKRVLMLSGTPFDKKENMYAQLRALDPDIFGTSYTSFKNRYCIMGGFDGRQIVKYINEDEFNKKIADIMYVVKRHDVLDLLPVSHENRYCNLSPKIEKIYKDLEKEFIAEVLDDTITASNALTKLLRLSQLCCGIVQFDEKDHPVMLDSAKMDTVKEIVEDIPIEEPIVVFGVFTPELLMLKKTIEGAGRTCAELSGKMNQLKDWQDGKFNTLICQIQSGKEGIDLTRACYQIYSSTGCNLKTYEQSLARTDRSGQTKSVTYYHVITSRTVDVKIANSLKNKKDVSESVIAEIKKLKADMAQNKKAA